MHELEVNSKSTFREWGEVWYRRKRLDFSSSYSLTAKNHLKNINRIIGDRSIEDIKVYHIDDLIIHYAELNPHTGRPTAKSTLKDMRNIAASVFDFACDYEVINKNPARGRQIPKKSPQNKRRALSVTEQQWIIALPHRMRFCALTMMLCGFRLGEIVPLTWTDFDMGLMGWNINKSVEKIGNKYILKPNTKNGKSRFVKSPLELTQEMQMEKEKAVSKYVFCKKNGEMHSPSSFRSAWKSYFCDLNFHYGVHDPSITSKYHPNGVPITIENIMPHMLRHTYATLLYSSEVDILTASKLLGHSDIKTTLEIYTHLEESKVAKSIDKLDSYVSEMFKTMR